MTTLAIVSQALIAAGIFNVWVVRRNRATPYRPDGAANIEEEFRRYGLPDWARHVVGASKLVLAALLVIGIFFTPVAAPAAAAMALLMIGAISAHIRVSDPWVRSLPAFAMLLLSTLVVVARTAA